MGVRPLEIGRSEVRPQEGEGAGEGLFVGSRNKKELKFHTMGEGGGSDDRKGDHRSGLRALERNKNLKLKG